MVLTVSLSRVLHPWLKVTTTLPFLTLTGVLGMDLTTLPTKSVTLPMAFVRSDNTTPALMETHSLSSYFIPPFLIVSSMWGLTEMKTTSLEEMTVWLSVVKVIFLK